MNIQNTEIDLFKHYKRTFESLEKSPVSSVFARAFWDTFGVTASFYGDDLSETELKNNGLSDGDLYIDVTKNGRLNGALEDADIDEVFSWETAAFTLLGFRREKEYNNPLRVIGRFIENIIKIPELFIRILDYGVEALLAKAIATLPNEDDYPVIRGIGLFILSITLGLVHIALKATSIFVRLFTSSSNTWKEADAIHPWLGTAARIFTIGLSVAVCVALPFLAPAFIAIHAVPIAHGLHAAAQFLVTVGQALGVNAAFATAAIAVGATVTAGAAFIIKTIVNLKKDWFHKVFSWKSENKTTTIPNNDDPLNKSPDNLKAQEQKTVNDDFSIDPTGSMSTAFPTDSSFLSNATNGADPTLVGINDSSHTDIIKFFTRAQPLNNKVSHDSDDIEGAEDMSWVEISDKDLNFSESSDVSRCSVFSDNHERIMAPLIVSNLINDTDSESELDEELRSSRLTI